MSKMNKLEEKINYYFKNKLLLEEALTHPSTNRKNRNGTQFNYEKLEFLGDSILSSIIAEYLIKHNKIDNEGDLSKKKAYFVSTIVLSKIAKDELCLNKYIIMSNGEEKTGGRNRVSNLENSLEAIIGAIFVDSNFDTAKEIVLKLWQKTFKENIHKSQKMELQELTQKYYKVLPNYNTKEIKNLETNESSFICELTIQNTDFMVIGSGKTKKEAEEKSAEKMVKKITEILINNIF